ncbi:MULTISPECIES: hypothetical protein [unclassified Streptomyces]|uniref:hypothetical protein n=1 Tax=unclassified Streptomyces TaxID=2593676 RepID=UPI0033B998F3
MRAPDTPADHLRGSRPDLLPGFLRNGEDVMLLDREDSRSVAAATLGLFPALSGDRLDWSAGSVRERRWWDDEDGWARLAAELLAPEVEAGALVAVQWSNLILPTVVLSAELAVAHARDLLDVEPHLWIHPLGGRVLLECLVDGQVTLGTVPPRGTGAVRASVSPS